MHHIEDHIVYKKDKEELPEELAELWELGESEVNAEES